ncbi:MAG: SAM hydrolase/SAM-dependent halogenase family protein [Mycobacteriales bacterium]
MSDTAWLTFLSDYGLDDIFVGVCKGVIAQRAPLVKVIDICHQVPPQDVEAGATVLAAALPYLPPGVHLALVDPSSGGKPNRGVVICAADGSLLVGPDNGLLSLGWAALGGAQEAFEIANPELWLQTPSPAFRGRDIYAPVAAYLAAGGAARDAGPPVSVGSLVHRKVREALVDEDHVHAEVRGVDHFGNLSLNVARSDLEAAGMSLGDTVEIRCGGRAHRVPFQLSYGEVLSGRLVLCEDAFRAVTLAVNSGDAGRLLRAGRGDPVVIARVQQAPARSRPEVTRTGR